jgi:pimeloyl-ACP methyl ester carboxylesterase
LLESDLIKFDILKLVVILKKILVLVHGLGAFAERWEHVIPELSKKYTVIAPDLPGFGYSDKPSLDYTPQFFAEFLSDFLETIGKNRIPMYYG